MKMKKNSQRKNRSATSRKPKMEEMKTKTVEKEREDLNRFSQGSVDWKKK